MNRAEIEQALSDFAVTPFDQIELPYGFLVCLARKAYVNHQNWRVMEV